MTLYRLTFFLYTRWLLDCIEFSYILLLTDQEGDRALVAGRVTHGAPGHAHARTHEVVDAREADLELAAGRGRGPDLTIDRNVENTLVVLPRAVALADGDLAETIPKRLILPLIGLI